jgi:anti-anti-sigma factor
MLRPVTADFDLTLPAEPETLSSVRRSLRLWAARCGATVEQTDNLVHAVSEAASNVIEHAYGPTGGQLEVHARFDDDRISVVVRDFGRWRSPRDENHGRGIALMHNLVDTAKVALSPDGTEVRLQLLLSSVREPGVEVPLAARPPALETDEHVAVVRLTGDIDLANATAHFHDVIAQVRNDSVGLIIDLSDVEHLDSAGLRMLNRVASRLATRRQTLYLVAPPASIAYRILHAAGIERFGPIVETTALAESTLRATSAQGEVH